MTTSHPVREYRLTVLARAFLLWLGCPGLFFQPTRQGIGTDTIETLNTSHTWPFVISSNDFLFVDFSVATLGFQYCAVITFFAPILLAAATVVPIFDNTFTPAAPTLMDDRCGYHPLSLSLIT